MSAKYLRCDKGISAFNRVEKKCVEGVKLMRERAGNTGLSHREVMSERQQLKHNFIIVL